MADRFYTNCALEPGELFLQGPEAHHLSTVSRHQPGDIVTLFNGDGAEYPASILSIGKKSVSLHIERVERPRREILTPVWIAAPIPKGDRADFLIEKLTEQGITDFQPLRTMRSVVEPRDTKLEKLRRHVIEASKQCGRNSLMRLHELVDWKMFMRMADLPPLRLIAHPGTGEVLRLPMIDRTQLTAGAVVALGPEGGFTDAEVESAHSAGWRSLSLGPRIQRIETAALTIAAWLTQLSDQ